MHCDPDELMIMVGIGMVRIYADSRVADVGGAQERRSTKGQGLLRKEGPPTYAILSRNSVLARFTRFLKGFLS